MWRGWDTSDTCYFGRMTKRGTKRYIKCAWKDLDEAPFSLLWSYLDMPIAAFTEVNEKWFAWQPNSAITYHAFTILEIENAGWLGQTMYLLLERCNNNLQMLFGSGEEVHLFMQQFYANGRARNVEQFLYQPRQRLNKVVTLRQFLEWLDNVVAREWQPYNLLAENCQHFVADMQRFLLNPRLVWKKSSGQTS